MGLVVTHFFSRFMYFSHSIFRKAVICQSFESTAFSVPGVSCHTTFVISKLNWTKILASSTALQYKKVQSFIEKFHGSKKLRKTENFSFNLNIRVSLESVNLFLHVCLCLKVILTMEHNRKLLIIFIWKCAIFCSWQLALWNLGQLAPA